ncbi:MAG TPA: hypothetical protein VH186_22670 [Chloroflexia bacterium]|nr:hypothetical protein [Chloroflexia bacterium]
MTGCQNSACCKLADLADNLANSSTTLSPKDFITLMGERAAGIRPGLWRYFDLLRGGQDLIPGKGFRSEYNDGSEGQVRHFAGIAVSTITFGPKLTIWISENIRLDKASSPDGRLTIAAIGFTTRLLGGQIPVSAAGEYIRQNLCQE